MSEVPLYQHSLTHPSFVWTGPSEWARALYIYRDRDKSAYPPCLARPMHLVVTCFDSLQGNRAYNKTPTRRSLQ
jgi:hypothetical protein